MGLAITTGLTQIMPLLQSLTRRSGTVASINMAPLMELVRLWRPQMRVSCMQPAPPPLPRPSPCWPPIGPPAPKFPPQPDRSLTVNEP